MYLKFKRIYKCSHHKRKKKREKKKKGEGEGRSRRGKGGGGGRGKEEGEEEWSSLFGTMGSAASLQCHTLVQLPALRSELKDLALPQLWCRSQLQLGSDPWPRNSICLGFGHKKKGSSCHCTGK